MTRTIFFQLAKAIIFCCTWAQFEASIGQESGTIFELDGRYGIKDSLGNFLVDPKFQELGWSPHQEVPLEGFIGYKQAGNWGLLSLAGKKLTSPKYYTITPFSDQLFLVSTKESLSNRLNYGLIDERGKQVLSNAFFNIEPLDELILVSKYEAGRQQLGLFNVNFEPLLPLEYVEVVKEQRLIFAREATGRWYCFNREGHRILNVAIDDFEVNGEYVVISRNGAKGLLHATEGTLLHDPVMKGFINLPYSTEPILPRKWAIYDRELNFIFDLDADSLIDHREVLVARLNGGQRLFADSTQILSGKSMMLQQAVNGHVVIKTKQHFEAYNADGKQIVTGDSIYYDGSYFLVREKNKWQVFNVFGRRVNKYPLDAVMASQEKYVPVKRAGHWGLMDFSGELIVTHVYDSIGLGFDASFPVDYIGSWGVINAFGRWLIQPAYQSMDRLSDLYVGRKRGSKTLLTRKGKNLYTTPDDLKLGNASIEVLQGDGVGLITTSGVVIFDPIYDHVKHLGDYYMAKRAEGAVLKDGLGAFVVRLDDGIQEILDYSEEFFLVKKDDLYGFIDERGRIRVANRYDSARHFQEDMAAIKLIGKWGFIDKTERLVIQPQYSAVGDFHHGQAIVRQDRYGLIDKDGNITLEVSFRSINRTEEGTYILEDNKGRKGLANRQGEIILTPSFDDMTDIGDGFIVAERNGRKGIYNHSGKLIKGFDFEEIISAESYIFMLPIR